MFGDVALAGAARVGTRGVQESTAGATGAIDDVFGEQLEILRVVVGFVAHHFNQTAPSVAEADDLIALAERAERDAANRGIEAGDVAASGENADDALLGVDVCHERAFVGGPFSVKLN